MLNKNENYELIITSLGSKGEGIGRINNFLIFVPNTLPEDIVIIKITKIKKTYAIAMLVKFLKKSSFRIEPMCNYFFECGGCTIQHLEYKEQLKYKTNKVKDSLVHIAKLPDAKILDTIGMEYPFRYRNKAQFHIAEINRSGLIGFYKAKTHTLIPINDCIIQHPIHIDVINVVNRFIKEYKIETYDEKNHMGIIRHLIVRTGFNTNEVMVCLVLNDNYLAFKEALIQDLMQIKSIKSVFININKDRTNNIMGKELKKIWGNDYIIDYINNIKFQISPFSFYQINPIQTEVLYNKVLEFANLKKTDIVIDAYCGIGTIALYISRYVKTVIGIEVVKEAINDAIINAKINNIYNVDFVVGKSEIVIPNLLNNNFKPNIIVIDPPRKGCSIKLIDLLIKYDFEKIIYVSCDPATMSRDIGILCNNKYKIVKVQPIDCFPMTHHVESVVLLVR